MPVLVSSGGPGSYINCGGGASLGVTTAYTFDMLMKRRPSPYSGPGYAKMAEKYEGFVGGIWLYMWQDPPAEGKMLIYHENGMFASTFDTTNKMASIGIWTRVAVTWSSGNKVNFYVNGVLIEQSVAVFIDPSIAGTPFYMAKDFDGILAEYVMYNRALSVSELLYNLNHPGNPIRRGIVMHQSQESMFGGSWADLSGLGNNGVITACSVGQSNNLSGRQVSL